ncbi:hypothetical protein RchiOBHm_Chr2g0135331 [Rosa chinensis]|uniref:Uncharacterized protein n=1 Tax=Rosa chinensis TaxID=74649 RepID=A0A2P6RW17_ROSCH|nr:hypothetical protein RchiOBHm_Chr2g0135331 [Rosa chinensis]
MKYIWVWLVVIVRRKSRANRAAVKERKELPRVKAKVMVRSLNGMLKNKCRHG